MKSFLLYNPLYIALLGKRVKEKADQEDLEPEPTEKVTLLAKAIATLHKRLIAGEIGTVGEQLRNEINQKIIKMLLI